MLTPLLFVSLALQGQTPTGPSGPSASVSASSLISKMFVRYSQASSLGGSVKTTQTAGSASVVTETNIAYERPSKIHLDQHQRGGQSPKDKLLVSDGEKFAYTPPDRVFNAAPYLVELVKPGERPAQTIGDLYVVVAADLPDRSPVLDALVARTDDLRYFANQLAQYRLTGRETFGSKTANVIEGDWRESDAVGVSGKFKMYLTDDGDLLRYVLTQIIGVPSNIPGLRNTAPAEQITVVTTWDTSITVNVPIKPNAFLLKAL